MRVGNRRGNSLVETALWFPVLILLLFGMIELARVTFTYYAVQKVLYSIARNVGTLQAANLCDNSDGAIQQAKTFAMSGSADTSAPSLIGGLTADMITVQLERQSEDASGLQACDCGSITQCDIASGSRPPDFVVVSIPDGYPVTVSFPYMSAQVVLFKPTVRVPFGGT